MDVQHNSLGQNYYYCTQLLRSQVHSTSVRHRGRHQVSFPDFTPHIYTTTLTAKPSASFSKGHRTLVFIIVPMEAVRSVVAR